MSNSFKDHSNRLSLLQKVQQLYRDNHTFAWFASENNSGDGRYEYLFFDHDQTTDLMTGHEEPQPSGHNSLNQKIEQFFHKAEDLNASGKFCVWLLHYELGHVFLEQYEYLLKNQLLAQCLMFNHAWRYDRQEGNLTDLHSNSMVVPNNDIDAPETMTAQISGFYLHLPYRHFKFNFKKVQQAIKDGAVYQVNYTASSSFSLLSDALDFFKVNLKKQKAAYGLFLNSKDRQVLSFSPELFFELKNSTLRTRPMKGTAKRGRYPEEDNKVAEWLSHDIKNRAENSMITDMMRNDLGKICSFGSVQVKDLFSVERFASLWQMTSTVTGELKTQNSNEHYLLNILQALFPGSSITGAPKKSAMKIIADIETSPRGIYTGSAGFSLPDKTVVFNIIIRTAERFKNQNTGIALSYNMGLGSGLVYDSVARDEYREWLSKKDFLESDNYKHLELIETMRFQENIWYIDDHLNRLEQSADYFQIKLNIERVKNQLQRATVELNPKKVYRLRLSYSARGECRVTSDEMPADDYTLDFKTADALPALKVKLASKRLNQENIFLFHKTNFRETYDQQRQATLQQGFEDILFFNSASQLTEGCISNLVLKIEERYLTPHIDCGLLSGIGRKQLLKKHRVQETVLYEQDLSNAGAVYLVNALRGVRKVVVT